MKLHIIREGHELGILNAGEARTLLECGFLRSDDQYWTDLPESAQPLARILDPGGRRPWMSLATSSVVFAGRTVRNGAVGISKKASALVRGSRVDAAVATGRALFDYIPRLRALLAERLAGMMVTSKAALQDEVFLRKLFGAAYDCLPKPLCRFVTEPAFVDFCFKHRRKLLR